MLSSHAVYKKAYEEHLEYLNYAEAIKIYAIELKSINKLQTPGLIDLLDMVILLAKTYQQAPKEGVLASIKTNFTNTILILLPKLPKDKQLEFYKAVCLFCLDLDKQITNSTFAYFANAIHLAEQVNQQDVLITKELEKFKIQARFSAMRPLIDYKLDKQNTIETYNVWQEIRPCLESAMALDVDSASSLFKGLENKLNLYVADFLSGSNNTQLFQLKLNKLLEDAKDLLAYNYEPYQRIARSWLHYIISKTGLEGIREAWENEKFKEKIYPKGQDSINGDFSLAKQYREELKALRAEFELNIKQPIFKTQANYTTQVISLLNKLAKDVASSLGEAPCTYSWIGIGSVSKGLLSPYSDLDCAILIENAEYRNHPYFTSFILSIDAVLKSLAEPWEFSAREEASCVGLRIDGGDLELIQAKKMPFIGTPLELANWVVEVGRTINGINYTEQTLAFSLLSPCLLYNRHNNNLLSNYQEQLYKNLSGICSTTGKLVHETIAINFWHSLITDDLNKSNLNIQQTSIDLKHDCINPLINLCTMAGLYYLINTKGILEANIGTILTNLEKKQFWHINYVKEIKEALEFLYKIRAELHLTSSKCYDTIELQNIPKWQAFKLASLTPWQGLVKLKYIFNGEENYHPLFGYARLIKEGLVSKQKLTFDLELESLAYLPHSDLYNTYLLLPNEYRKYVIQGLQAIDAPIAVLEYYLNLPNHLGISLNKEKNLLDWQNILLNFTEKYNPKQKLNYIQANRVMLEWVVIEDGVAKKISRLFPQRYRFNNSSAAYFENGKFNIAELEKHQLIIQEGKGKVLKLTQNNSLVAYAKTYPEAPGVQLQADTLSQHLSGTNFHSTLAKVIPLSNPQQSFPLLFSQVVAETIQEHLNQDKDLTEIETQLDPFYFSLKLLETLVISPEDDKPDNVGLYRLANNKYRLISFDADHAFYPAMVERIGITGKERKVQLKSITLCFAQMQNAIHPDAKSLFLSFKPYDLLQDFLLELDANYQQQLFTPAEIQKFLKDKYWLANAFEVGTVAKLYEQILRIQAALKDDTISSHLDLLARVEPLASDYYLKLYQYTSPRERWEALQPDTEYKLVVNQSGHIVCQSGLTATTRAKRSITVAKERKDKSEAYNPHLALAELQGIHNQYQQINNLINQLNQGNSKNFIVSYPFIQEQVLKRLDFKHNEKLNAAIKNLQNLYELHLRNCALIYTDLIAILANQQNLRVLNLSGCKNIIDYWRSMGWALSYVPHLEYLNLSDTNINTLTSNVPFSSLSLPKLRRLILHNCPRLSNLIINAPNLEYLQIKGCNLLPIQAIETLAQTYPKLIRLELINNLSFNLKGLTQITWPELTQLSLTISQDNLPEISNYLPLARQYLPRLNQINLQKCGIEIDALSGHQDAVLCLAVLANGNLASGSWDNTIRIWDTVSYNCIATLKGHRGGGYCLAGLANGNLASGSDGGTIKIWDTSYTCIATLTGHQRGVSCFAVLANGNLASGSYDGVIKIWDTVSYTCVASLKGHQSSVLCLAVLANGNLASGFFDNTIKIWDTVSYTCIASLKGHQRSVHCLAKLANDNLASGSYDKTIKIWDIVSSTCIATLPGHQRGVSCLAELANGNLASGSLDNTIRIWDTVNYTCIASLIGHQSSVLRLAELANGNLASGSLDGVIKIWDFSSLNLEFGLWQELELIELDDLSLSWQAANIAASNSLKACAEFLGEAKLLNTKQIEFKTKESLGRFLLTVLGGELTSSGRLRLNLNLANLRSLSIKNSNIVEEITGSFAGSHLTLQNCPYLSKLIISSSNLEYLKIDNCNSLDERLITKLLQESLRLINLELINNLSFNLKGLTQITWPELTQLGLTVSQDNLPEIINYLPLARQHLPRLKQINLQKDGLAIKTLSEHQSEVSSLAVLANGNLVSGSSDGVIKIWDTSYTCITGLKGHKSAVLCLAGLANGNLASGSSDGVIKIWDTSYTCIATLTGHQGWVCCLAELANGNLASGSFDKTIKIWDTVSYNCIATLPGHQGSVSCLAELANGNLASSSFDKTIKIWNTVNYTCIASLKGHQSWLSCLAELANVNLASGSSDGIIKIWDTSYTCITSLKGHKSAVLCLAGLANGNLASSSYDNTIKIWDTVNYTCIASLKGHQREALCLAALGNGNLASGSFDKTIKIWDFSSLSLEFGLWQELELIELDDLSLGWRTSNITASNSLKACAEFLGEAKLLNTEQLEFKTKESLGRFLLTVLGGELTSSGRLKLNLNLANLRSLSIKNSNIVEEITGSFAQLENFDVDNHIVIIHNNLTTTYADELQDSIIGDNTAANDTIRTLTLNAVNFVQKTNKSKYARDLEGNLEPELYEIELPGDGNCALHGLGISRSQAIEQLIKHGSLNEDIRKSMLQDINELINEAESITSNIQGVTTTEIYIALKREKDLVLFTLNQKMNFLNDRFELNGNDCKNDLPGFLDLLREFSPEYLELQKLEQEKLLAEQAILDYLMLPDIYENFIRSSYEKPKVDGSWQWLSFAVMQVLAEINKMNLVIKKLSADNTYDSMYEWIINDGPVRTLLYTQAGTKDGYNGSNLNHFNALSIVPDKLCDPMRANIASSDKLTAIQRENNFNLFNQEQLVSKNKNLIWSQVQENISIDSNFQNSCVDPVFDELVDTGFFNSFADDFDENDMTVECTKHSLKL